MPSSAYPVDIVRIVASSGTAKSRVLHHHANTRVARMQRQQEASVVFGSLAVSEQIRTNVPPDLLSCVYDKLLPA